MHFAKHSNKKMYIDIKWLTTQQMGSWLWPLKEIHIRRVENVVNREVKNAKLKGKCKLKKICNKYDKELIFFI